MVDERTLTGRHVIVTGASRGIGLAVAGRLAARGAVITLVARDKTRLEAARASLGPAHAAVAGDVAVEAEAERAMDAAMDAHGAPWGLVNNAGTAEAAAFLASNSALWRRMLDVNLISAVTCTRRVLPAMQQAGGGRIVNVASLAALTGFRYVSAYVASKHALLGMTRALALETARDGITVNAVCPGYTETPMLEQSITSAAARTGKSAEEIRAVYAASNPGGRLVQPDEVARAVAWLCEPAQAALSGQALTLDDARIPQREAS